MRALWVLMLLAATAHAGPTPDPLDPPPEEDRTGAEPSPISDVPPSDPAPPSDQAPGDGATGEAAAPAPAPAVSAFEAGRRLLGAGKFEEACAQFIESLTEDPDAPGTLLNLGLCNEKLGKTATALGWYRKAQFRSSETQLADVEKAAKQQTIELAAKVPILRIEAAAGARVTLDGSALSEVERARIEVDPGTHVLETDSVRRTVTVHDGDKLAIDLRPPPPRRFVIVDRGARQRHLAYAAAGVGVAFYAATLTLSVVGRRKYDAAEHPGTYGRWQDIVRYGSTSLFVAGTAALAGGIYLFVRSPRAERIEQVAPIIGGDRIGVAVAGSF